MIVEHWHYNNDKEKEIIITWLYNLYKTQFDNGLANITQENDILVFRKIVKEL